jgi:photosystem II stability/assembly factor-like uncharacterized protein
MYKRKLNLITFFLIFSLSLALLVTTPAFALTPSASVRNLLIDSTVFYANSPKAYVNGAVTLLATNNATIKLVVKNNITLVPLEFLADSLGGTLRQDPKTSEISVYAEGSSASLKPGSNKMKLDRKEVTLDAPVQKISNIVYVPLKPIVEKVFQKKIFSDRGLYIVNDLAGSLDKKKDQKKIDELILLFKDTKDYIPAPVLTERKSFIDEDFSHLLWTGSKFMINGIGPAALESSDGKSWTSRKSNTKSGISEMIRSGNLFLAIGDEEKVYTSADCVTWTNRTSKIDKRMNSIAWNGTKYVAVGETILTSTNGIDWTEQKNILLEDNYLMNLVWGKNQFMAVGDKGNILTSPDGIKWTVRTSGTKELLLDVEWNGKLFVAGGYGVLMTSTDGIVWTKQVISRDPRALFKKVTWGGKCFLAVGLKVDYNVSTLYISKDGITWSKTTKVDRVITDVVFNKDTVVLLGHYYPNIGETSKLYSMPVSK